MTRADAYNTWIARLNEIKNTPAESNGYVNAGTEEDHYWIDNNGMVERFDFDFDRCPSCDGQLEKLRNATGEIIRFCRTCIEVYR